jgi:hypothetical protein
MPVMWTIARGVVLLESQSEVTFGEWRAAVDEFNRHPDYRPGMGVIHDWRKRTTLVTADDARARARYLERLVPALGTTRWAAIVEREADFGLARMVEILLDGVSGIDYRVFRDPVEAEAWARGAAW